MNQSTALVPPLRVTSSSTGERWVTLVRVAILVGLVPALLSGFVHIESAAIKPIAGLFGGYALLLALGLRWPLGRWPDLPIAADIIVITAAVLASGHLHSPFIYLYYLAVVEAAARFTFRQAGTASLTMAAMIALFWGASRKFPLVDAIGLRRSAFMIGGFLLAMLLGAIVHEYRSRSRRPQPAPQEALPPVPPPSGADAAPEAPLDELQFSNQLTARLAGELRIKSVLAILIEEVLEATGLATGAAFIAGEDGVPRFAAALNQGAEEESEPAGLELPALPSGAVGGEVLTHRAAGQTESLATAAIYIPLVHGGSLRAWLCALGASPEPLPEPTLRCIREIAVRGAAALETARLHEEVQRMTNINPARSLYPWPQLSRLITEEIRRSTELLLVFSLAEVRLADYGGTNWTGDREGDLALRRVVKVMQTSLRRVDVVSHDGAGRFILLLPRVPKEEAAGILERLSQKVENDSLAARLLETKRLTVIVGLVTFPEDGSAASDLLEKLKGLIAQDPSTPGRVRVPSG